jgi:hypothetical protein
MRKTPASLIVLASLLATVAPISGADYYVDALSGDDITGDGTPTTPWRTITRALSLPPTAGSVIHVAPGIYDETLGETFPILMLPGITARGADRDTTVVAGVPDEPVFQVGPVGIFDEDTIIENLTIEGGLQGVLVGSEGDATVLHPIIRRCRIQGNQEDGIRVYERDLSDTRVTITQNLIVGNLRNGLHAGWRNSGYLPYEPGQPVILASENIVTDNEAVGLWLHTVQYARAERNRVQRNRWGVFLYADPWVAYSGGTDHPIGVLENNLVAENTEYGLWLHGGETLDYYYYIEPVLTNNTITGNADTGILATYHVIATLTNNIIWGNALDLQERNTPWSITSLYLSYCDVGDFGTAIDVVGNISADPLFEDPASGDYSLSAASPCIDAGTSDLAPTSDIDWYPRADDPAVPNTGGGAMPWYDMGAFEHVGGDTDGDTVPDALDCASLDPSVWTVPGEVHDLRLEGRDVVTLSWDPQVEGGIAQFEVATGSVDLLRADLGFARTQCLAGGIAGGSYADSRPGPGADGLWYYLVRAVNTCGNGTFGDSSLSPDPRDALDAAFPPSPCP